MSRRRRPPCPARDLVPMSTSIPEGKTPGKKPRFSAASRCAMPPRDPSPRSASTSGPRHARGTPTRAGAAAQLAVRRPEVTRPARRGESRPAGSDPGPAWSCCPRPDGCPPTRSSGSGAARHPSRPEPAHRLGPPLAEADVVRAGPVLSVYPSSSTDSCGCSSRCLTSATSRVCARRPAPTCRNRTAPPASR